VTADSATKACRVRRDKGAYSGQVDGRSEKECAIVVVSTRTSSWPPPCPCPCPPKWANPPCHARLTCTRCPPAIHLQPSTASVYNLLPPLLQTHA